MTQKAGGASIFNSFDIRGKQLLSRLIYLLLLTTPLMGVSSASADAGWISVGGEPCLLSENPSISMSDEVVEIEIHKEIVKVDCRYTFVNHGPACKVRMGFPDEASEVDVENSKTKPFGTFLNYVAEVDSAPVPVDVLTVKRDDMRHLIWHANDVNFARGQTRKVRNVYSTCPNISGGEDSDNAFVVGYILSTAASWHGALNKAVINITIGKDALPFPIHLFAAKSDDVDDDILVLYGHLDDRQADNFEENVRKKLFRKAMAKRK